MTSQEEIEVQNRLCALEKQVKQLIKYVKSKPKEPKADKTSFVCKYCGKEVKKPTPGTCSYAPNGNHVFIKS